MENSIYIEIEPWRLDSSPHDWFPCAACLTRIVSEHDSHHSDVIMCAVASQIIGVAIVCSAVCWGADQRKKSSASRAFVRGIHRWPVDSPNKGPVTRKMFLFDDVIMIEHRTSPALHENMTVLANSHVMVEQQTKVILMTGTASSRIHHSSGSLKTVP